MERASFRKLILFWR